MKMASGGMKGVSALVIAWITYIDNTFTPLFWVLLVLVALDMFLNVHKEGQQFLKIGSMAISLGAPSYIAANLGDAHLGKYLVAIMCLVYLQIVVPEIINKINKLNFSKNPTQNAADQATLDAVLAKLAAMEQAQAAAVVKEVAPEQPTIIGDNQKGGN